jgi:tetratricopeptide (TPR) repeat protein
MKKFFSYSLLVILGFAIGSLGKIFYYKMQGKTSDLPLPGLPGPRPAVELSLEDETRYRRAHNETLTFIKDANPLGALNSIEKMLKLAPGRVQPHVLYAETALELMRWKRGFEVVSSDAANIRVIEAHVQKALELKPDDEDVLMLEMHYFDWQAMIHKMAGQKTEAIRYFQKARDALNRARKILKYDAKKSARLILEDINLLRHEGQYDKALSQLDLALTNRELAFMKGQIFFNRALIYMKKNDNEKAEKNFQKALESKGASLPLILRHRAKFYEKLGFKDLALDDYLRLKKWFSKDTVLMQKIIDLRKKNADEILNKK